MVTFFICLFILIAGYLVYSRYTERSFEIDDRETPAIKNPDGIDIIPLPKWKAFLIELLNIAGTGPIFGAISGALFGPIAFIWIVVGCLLGGAVHDYYSGMISSRNNGESIVSLSGRYLGKIMEVIMRIFSIILLILVTAVFVVSPSSLLSTLTGGHVHVLIWMGIILAYYFISTIFPIDKIIGKAYPVFGVILIAMALSVIIGIMANRSEYPMIEFIGNIKDFSKMNGELPWWPFMFTTIACGAVSGFHATQSPMIAKCIKTEKEGRQIFYGAMVAEGIIALIWAAAAMAFYRVNTPDGFKTLNEIGGNSNSVYEISKGVLGPTGTVLAVVGVIICPITSGDTALRSARLILGETFKLDQKKLVNRIILTIPLFAIIIGISIWDFLSPSNFNILWRWFAWSNQVLATISLWVATGYILKENKNKFASFITSIPATFMSAVVICYILGEPTIALGKYIPALVANLVGIGISYVIFGFYIYKLIKAVRRQKMNIEQK